MVILAGLAAMSVGLFLMSHIQADTQLPVLWVWMFITGLGIGPTLAVFTIVVQNAVPFSKLGVATSNLTFFRQIGGLWASRWALSSATASPRRSTRRSSRRSGPDSVAAGVPPRPQGPAVGGGPGHERTRSRSATISGSPSWPGSRAYPRQGRPVDQ